MSCFTVFSYGSSGCNVELLLVVTVVVTVVAEVVVLLLLVNLYIFDCSPYCHASLFPPVVSVSCWDVILIISPQSRTELVSLFMSTVT